jgi:hypothetical protein
MAAMDEIPRLASGVWVSAYRMRLEAAGLPCYVAARGDPTAGAVLVKIARLDGGAQLMGRIADLDGARRWDLVESGDEAAVDAAIARQRRFDPDLWVIEVEDRAGCALLDDPSLS